LDAFNVTVLAPDILEVAGSTTITDIATIAQDKGYTLSQLNSLKLTFHDLDLTTPQDSLYNVPVMRELGPGTGTYAVTLHAPGEVSTSSWGETGF
jgi:hypothetical protein